jgi:hypothetical protein
MTFMKKPIVFWEVSQLSRSMDPRTTNDKVGIFAQQLLKEAQGDPIRALGLLALVLDGPEIPSPAHAWRLMIEVRRILIPDAFQESPMPIQHLAGTVSWEGIQHCLRCGKILAKHCHESEDSLLPGHVFEIGPRLTSEPCEDYRPCS